MIAHVLTGMRLLAVAPAAWAFSRPGGVSVWVLGGVMLVAIVTDYYDGVVARATGTASAGGMLFDHTTEVEGGPRARSIGLNYARGLLS